jgi:hypothetical protein
MAMIDYGAITKIDGVLDHDEMFQDMKKVVGWNDNTKTSNDRMNGNCFRYIGDKDFTLGVYKTHVYVAVNQKLIDIIWCGFYSEHGVNNETSENFMASHKYIHRFYNYNGFKFDIKKVGNCIYNLHMDYKGKHYHILYGYGIDPDMKVWNRVKYDYGTKKDVRYVDKFLTT